MDSAVLYPYNPPDSVEGLSEGASRRCPFPCCFKCLHDGGAALTKEQREQGLRLAFRTLSDEAGCPPEQQEEWLLGIRDAAASVASAQRRAEAGAAVLGQEAATARGLVLYWAHCGMLLGVMRVAVASREGYVVYLCLDILCTLAAAGGELLALLLRETVRLTELLVRVLLLSSSVVPEGIKGAVGAGGAVMAMSSTQLFVCKERALTCLPFLLSGSVRERYSLLTSKAVMDAVLPYWDAVDEQLLLEDWCSPDGDFQQEMLLSHSEAAPSRGSGEVHDKLRPYASRYAAILQERAAIALEAACLSVCDDCGACSLWLDTCGGAKFVEKLWSAADSDPIICFGESYLSTAATVMLNCIATAGPVVDSLRLEGLCGLVEQVLPGHWHRLVSLLARTATQLTEAWADEFGQRLRLNPCRTSALTEEGLRKIMEDIAAKAANAVHMLATAVAHPATRETLQDELWATLVEHTLALGFGYARQAEAALQKMSLGQPTGVTIDHPRFEDSGHHVLGLRSPAGGVECTHWTHPLLVSCSVFLSYYLVAFGEEPKELVLQSCLFVRRFAESRLWQCELRARALLEVGIQDEPAEEWVDLCITEPSDTANPSNAALYWACCGQVCALALERTTVLDNSDDAHSLHEARAALVVLESLAWITAPHGAAPSQTALERSRNALVATPAKELPTSVVGAVSRLLKYVRKQLANRCGTCGKRAADVAKLQVCSGCKATNYCSRQCQKEDWRRHKLLCRKSE